MSVRHITSLKTLFLAVCLTAAPLSAAGQQLVPLITDQTPLALPTTFGAPGGGAVNQAGDYVFQGSDSQAIFLRRAGAATTVRLLQMGDEVPGFPGSRADQISVPWVNNAGLVAFRVDTFRISGRATGVILTFDGTTLQSVVSGADAAPGGGGALFERGIALLGLTDSGALIFSAPLVPSNSGLPSQTTVFIKPAGGAVVRVMGIGDVAPGAGGATFTGFSNFGTAGVNNLDEILVSANLTGAAGARGLFVGGLGGVRKVAASTDVNPLGGLIGLTTGGRLNNAGQVAFSSANGTLWLHTIATGNSPLVVPAGAVPAPLNGTFGTTPTIVTLSDTGEVGFTQAVVGSPIGNLGLFRHRPSNPLEIVAYRNQPAPGVPGRVFSNFQAVSGNNSGVITFRATDVVGEAQIGIFQQSSGSSPISVVLQNDSAPLTGGGTYSLANPTQTLDDGSLFFRSNIVGGDADYGEFLRSAGGTSALMNTADALPAGARVVTRTFRLGAAADYVGLMVQYAAGKTSIALHNIPTQASTVVVQDGQIAPGTGGGRLRITTVSSVFVNASGTIAFSASITGGTAGLSSGIFLGSVGTGLSKVAVNTDLDAVGAVVGSLSINGITRSPLNDAGQVVFLANGRVYVESVGTAPSRVVNTGMSLAGIGTVTGYSFTGDFHMSTSGSVAFVALSATSSGLFLGTPGGTPVKVAAVGDAAPGGGTFQSFTQPVFNNVGEVLFGAGLSGGGAVRGVFLRTSAPSLVAVARDGDAAPGGGTFDFTDAIRDVAINDQQDVVFRANVVGGPTNSGYFARRGHLSPIAALLVQGQPAPGTSQVFATVTGGLNGLAREDIQLSPGGDVAIQAGFVDVDGLRTAGIWHAKADNTLEVLVIRADVATEFGGGAALITTPGGAWNSGGRFAITARISGGSFTDGVFLFVPTTVAPTPEGTNVVVIPPDSTTGTTPVTMAFSNVSEEGETSVTTSAAGPIVPTAFQIGDPPVFYNLETTAVFNGAITVCVDFTGVSFPNGAPLALLHFENGAWHDVTTSGPTDNVICGSVTSLSPFTVARVLNVEPVANAGADQTVECCGPAGATVTLNGSASSDPDNDTLTYVWTDSSDNVVGNAASVPVTLPRGTYTFTLTVTDPYGKSSSAITHVTVQDTVAPTLAVSVTPSVIALPNNKLVTVSATIVTNDLCDANPAVALVSITSNEALAAGDVQGAAFGTDDRTFQLRATRNGKGSGRTYTITYRVTDSAGNSTQQQVQVVVQHDQGGGS